MSTQVDQEETPPPNKIKEGPVQHVIQSTGYSITGLGSTLKHELAFRIECVLAAILIPLVLVMPIEILFKALCIFSILMVLVAELLNSGLEWVVDYISHERHPYAKRAKDMGSAAVFVALVNAGLMLGLAILQWQQIFV